MKLSEFELDVMRLFWERGELSSPEVCDMLAEKKKVACNTIKTIIHRLEDKGAIKRIRRIGRTLIYIPMVSQESITVSLLPNFLNRFFSGSPQKLVSHLIEEEYLSDDDIDELQALLDKKRKSKESV